MNMCVWMVECEWVNKDGQGMPSEFLPGGLKRWEPHTTVPHRLETALRIGIKLQMKNLSKVRLRHIRSDEIIPLNRLIAFEIKNYLV